MCDLVAILSLVLQKLPENHELINQILLSKTDEDDDSVNYVDLLRHSNSMLQERMCYFFMYLAKHSLDTLELLWDVKTRETLEALAYDSVESVRNVGDSLYWFFMWIFESICYFRQLSLQWRSSSKQSSIECEEINAFSSKIRLIVNLLWSIWA